MAKKRKDNLFLTVDRLIGDIQHARFSPDAKQKSPSMSSAFKAITTGVASGVKKIKARTGSMPHGHDSVDTNAAGTFSNDNQNVIHESPPQLPIHETGPVADFEGIGSTQAHSRGGTPGPSHTPKKRNANSAPTTGTSTANTRANTPTIHTPGGNNTPAGTGGNNTPAGTRGKNTPAGTGGNNTPARSTTPAGTRGHNTPAGQDTPAGQNTPIGDNTPTGSGTATPVEGGRRQNTNPRLPEKLGKALARLKYAPWGLHLSKK